MAIRSPAMRQHCTGREAGHAPGPILRPWRGAQALRLAGDRIATPACALVRNDRLGSAVGLEAAGRFREADGGGEPPPYGTGFGDASGPTHPAPIMHP